MKKFTSSVHCFQTYDRDGDANLNYDEFKLLCLDLFCNDENVPYDINDEFITEIFHVFDWNEDNLIDLEEFGRCYEEWIKTILAPRSGFLVIDMQNDFISGSLAVPRRGNVGPADLINAINELAALKDFSVIICSQDWHDDNHISFFENVHLRPIDKSSPKQLEQATIRSTVVFEGNPPRKQILWPIHCVKNTFGAELHAKLKLPSAIKIYKGTNSEVDSYSAFWDNDRKSQTELEQILKGMNISDLFVCGLCTDYCVGSTILHALEAGFRTVLVSDCSMSITEEGELEMLKKIKGLHGVKVSSKHVFNMVSGKDRNPVMAYKHAMDLKRKYVK